ncbi:MAG TPA: cobalamin-independent methionine synthase II family protein [Beijerinckiaceae bacterium]|nr:cobalamin-independent methionine synthase II family protein [Beijerinckiaceae bacterium]
MAAAASDLRRIRVDQVGSLVNPQFLLDAFVARDAGKLSDDQLAKAQDEAIVQSIAKQDAIGFPFVTDGEMRRRNFQDGFADSVSGYERAQTIAYHLGVSQEPNARAEQNFAADGPAIVTRRGVVEKLKLVTNVPLNEFRFAQGHTRSPVKATILSPDRIVQRFAYERSTDIYRDREAFLADVVAIERKMIVELIEAGCRYIQIDAPGYTAYVDEVSLSRMRARGEDPARNLDMSIAADNDLIRGFEGVLFGIHICRGNARTRDPKTGRVAAQFHREGHYDAIAERLFTSLDHDRWLLEYDSERAGDFTPLGFFPKDRIVVLGVVTTKSSDVESKDDLRRRIDDAARFLPVEQLAISPQCGFGGLGHVTITQDEQWRKMERLLEVAADVWREQA